MILTNSRQEIFTQNWFKGKTKEESAIIAGYAPKWAFTIASRLSRNVKVLARYNELQTQASNDIVLNFEQRQNILSEIASGNLLDYQEVGADGGYLSVGKDSPNTKAISEITSRTEYDKNGSGAALVTKLKLHNPIQAIAELNKMDHVYESSPAGYQDNRVINIIVMDSKTKELMEKVKDRTGSLIEGQEEVDI